MPIDRKDIRTEFVNINRQAFMRLTHLPTGEFAEGKMPRMISRKSFEMIGRQVMDRLEQKVTDKEKENAKL